jgi:hypothetical protein
MNYFKIVDQSGKVIGIAASVKKDNLFELNKNLIYSLIDKKEYCKINNSICNVDIQEKRIKGDT